MKKGKLILVEWNDSHFTPGWRPDDCKGDDIAHCRTVGILKIEDDEKVTVAFGDSDSGCVMETITIPKGCITGIRKLRIR